MVAGKLILGKDQEKFKRNYLLGKKLLNCKKQSLVLHFIRRKLWLDTCSN